MVQMTFGVHSFYAFVGPLVILLFKIVKVRDDGNICNIN